MENKVRIQKVLSDQGILSRRKAEEYIAQGRITVNGRPAQVGHPIDVRKDIIAIDGERIYFSRRKQNLYIMLHKPRGYVTTMADEKGRRCVADLVADLPVKVYPVGRLDKDSEGLLLLTNDGSFANTLMHPSNHIGKTYRVTVPSGVTEDQLIQLSSGVSIDDGLGNADYTTQPATVHVVDKTEGRTVLLITIFEGKNRQIRRMCEAVGLEVARLKRVSIGPVKLGMLKPGTYRELKPLELSALRNYMNKANNRTQNELGEAAAKEREAKGGSKPFGRGKGGQSGRAQQKGPGKRAPLSAPKRGYK